MKFDPIKQKGLVMTALEEDGHKITSLDIDTLVPGMYGQVTFRKDGDSYLLDIPKNMTGERFRFWKKTAAGLFLKDYRQFKRDAPHGEWLLVSGKKYQSIVRLIDESEIGDFTAYKMLHGKIKDKYYMHLKTVNSDKNINWNTGYIKQIDDELGEFEEAQLEAALLEESLTVDGEKTKQKAPRPGSLFK